jgi:hypothetical protein
MQPTWLPWAGYLDLIDQVDCFVFLDTTQFQKQTWQQRNRIKVQNKLEWITVPALIKGRFGQLIKDVEIQLEKFPRKQLKQISQSYSKTPFFEEYFPEFEEILLNSNTNSLCDINITIINWLCSKFKIETKTMRASEINVSGKRGELVVNILKHLGSSSYLSPMGSLEYLREDINSFDEAKINVKFQNFIHPEYKQMYEPFISGASAIDLLFNKGEDSINVIRSGRGAPILAETIL